MEYHIPNVSYKHKILETQTDYYWLVRSLPVFFDFYRNNIKTVEVSCKMKFVEGHGGKLKFIHSRQILVAFVELNIKHS